MTKLITIYMVVLMVLAVTVPLQATWQRTPASDVDKEFISGNAGLAPGLPPSDMSCWMAAASNMLAEAGYGDGTTIQERADGIYYDMLIWQRSIDATNIHGVKYGGWMDSALNWWLASANNTQAGTNPYTVVTVYGNTDCTPWSNTNGARFIGNKVRDYQAVSIAIRWPKAGAGCNGGHALTPLGDDGTYANLAGNPAQIILADSDRDNGGPFQTYAYDNFTNPNPGGTNEGNGWYFNFSADHAYIVQAATLSPTDSPVNPYDGPTQKVVGSYKINQNDLENATDLHYTAWTDYNILGYRTEIDWPTSNDPCIAESNTHVPSLERSDIQVDWDLSDNPVPYNKDVTITTEFILQNWNGLWYDNVYFTYPGAEDTKYFQLPDSTLGTDIRIDNDDGTQRLLADDFSCIRTGEITKIYLWGSWKNDYGEGPAPGNIQKFHLYIYSDDPAGDNPNDPNDEPDNRYSKPLELLWSGNFDQFTETVYSYVPEEYFWDTYTAELGWDNRIWTYVIDIPEADAFKQQGSRTNPVTYWLGVSTEITGDGDIQFGWKTTDLKSGWNDTAVAWKDDYTLTDEFDYWEDQTSHSYTSSGYCAQGAYGCNTNNSLRIGNCDANSSAQIEVAVIPGTDKVKLRYKIPWAGSATAGTTLYVDGVNQGSITGNDCSWQEKILTGMSAYTADGVLEINIVDEIDGCAGDVQITYIEVYSTEKKWSPMFYPANHELAGYPVDMSFGIVTPATAPGTFLPAFGWNIVTAELADTNVVDITGGYIVGGFDLYDMSGEPNFMGQYRFVHQYPYTQDPEHHIFTIQGPNDQNNCEYVATNFRFGHSYGMPDSKSLWQFNEWMTTSEDMVYLCPGGQPLRLALNWQGRLPYPPSNITPADQMPEIPRCTVYLDADLNRDCCVDFKDFAMLADDWLQCTIPY